MQLVYYVPYGTDYLQSLIFGIALSYVASFEATGSVDAADRANPEKSRVPRWRWT